MKATDKRRRRQESSFVGGTRSCDTAASDDADGDVLSRVWGGGEADRSTVDGSRRAVVRPSSY